MRPEITGLLNSGFLGRVINLFGKVAISQEEKGLVKYGHGVDPIDGRFDWLDMAIEEQVDGFKYLLAERERRNWIIKQALPILYRMRGRKVHDPGDVDYLITMVSNLGKLPNEGS